MSQGPTSQGKVVTAAVVVIGNEVLSGRTRDANLHYLAARLNELGVRLLEARVVSDDQAAIVAAVNECRARHDYVFTTGGIGPTHDDITAEAVAKAFGVGIGIDPRARAILESHYDPGQLNEARLRMARMPDGASLIANPISRAPGFRIGNVFVMAGVPAIMQAMFESIRHELVGGAPLISRTISARLPEGQLAGPLARVQEAHKDVQIGSYPYYRGGALGTSIVLRATDRGRLEAAAADVRRIMREAGGEPIEGDAP
jgi:molybdenum cofactor synthesis domain-containing protein